MAGRRRFAASILKIAIFSKPDPWSPDRMIVRVRQAASLLSQRIADLPEASPLQFFTAVPRANNARAHER
jgi:hypothetical protein